MRPSETLSDLAIFVAVVKAGTFTAAAGRLELSKSQVSKCVNRLEARLGARLLHRTTRRLHLTEAGTALYETGDSALEAIEAAQHAISRLQGAPRGTLKVSASTAFGTLQLPAVVAVLTRRYPDLNVELVLEDRHVDLVREGIDVAIRITGEPPDSGMVYRRLGPNRQVVCAAPAYLNQHGVPRTPADLAAHECIAHTQRATPRVWRFTTPHGGRTSVQIRGRIAISGALAVREAALQGLGIIELNSYMVGPEITAGRLTPVLDGFTPEELSVYAVFPGRRFLAPKVRAFVDAMLERMTPEPIWDEYRFARGRAARAASGSRTPDVARNAARVALPRGAARRR